MNTKLISFVVILLVLCSTAYAQSYEVSQIREVLKKNLQAFFISQTVQILTLSELKDLLIFYLAIPPNMIVADADTLGAYSGTSVSEIIDNGTQTISPIPKCADGTDYSECSLTRPKFCLAGSLVDKCDTCGCPTQTSCNANYSCQPAPQIDCASDLDCGTTIFVTNYYCSANTVYKSYVNYSCQNPGTINALCINVTGQISFNYCNPAMNKTCVNGQLACNSTLPVDSAAPVRSNGYPNGSLSANTNATSISLSTNEAATCKYAVYAGMAYDNMFFNFSGAGTTWHYNTVTGLSNWNNYTYYVKCSDALGNKNTNDFNIAFSVLG